ncbi:MAG: hypothetical protein GXZ07_10040 [Firmicutes bacterium]|nr:hypothetical protein [Bacillota bacterium]
MAFINQYDEWDFDDLTDEILPYVREELTQIRDTRIVRAKKKVKKKEENRTPAKIYVNTLWEARLTDLQRLAFMRHGSQLPSGTGA